MNIIASSMQEKRDEIKKQYQSVFEELRQMCAESHVPYQINEQSILHQVTGSDNIYVLAGNVNTSDYRAEQVKDIMIRRSLANGGGDTSLSKRRIRMVSLHTGSKMPLNTEADVDKYLSQLKEQLMKWVSTREEHEDIMVK